MKRIVLFGGSGHARSVIDVIQQVGGYEIVGVLQPGPPTSVLGYPTLGTDDRLPYLMQAEGIVGGLAALGDNARRREVMSRITTMCPDFEWITACHPEAVLGQDVCLGPGTVVMARAVLNCGTQVGRGCILNTCCAVDHDNVLGDFSSIGPGATLGGSVQIGSGTAVGLGANLIQHVGVGDDTLIGAGATVLRDVPSRVVAFGTPARVVREHVPGTPYLHPRTAP